MNQTQQDVDAAAARRLLLLIADRRQARLPRALIVVAHPDDETIGLASLLPRFACAKIIYTTDGAPLDMQDAARAGFATQDDYRTARQAELQCALALAGQARMPVRHLPFPDKEATLNLAELILLIRAEIEATAPRVIFTHAYEGGHPDHDATAFVVHRALRNLAGESSRRLPVVLEIAGYHRHARAIRRNAFLPNTHLRLDHELTIELTPAEQQMKQSMFRCFASQASVLADFAVSLERYRIAPPYDFTCPPHRGRLHYETFGWGWTGKRWREYARRAL